MTPNETFDDLASTPEQPAPAPKKRGRPRKNPLPEGTSTVIPVRRRASKRQALVDTETATLDAYQREEPLPVDDALCAPSGAPIANETENVAISEPISAPRETDEAEVEAANEDTNEEPRVAESAMFSAGAEEWFPSVQAPDGKIYIEASTTTLESPEGEEWKPKAQPRMGEPEPKPENPAPVEGWTPPPREDVHPTKQKGGHTPYPTDMDPATLASQVKPSDALKAALAGRRLSRQEIRKLTRRERAYLRAVQQGSKMDYATFVARGIAVAQSYQAQAQAQGTATTGAVAQALPQGTSVRAQPMRPSAGKAGMVVVAPAASRPAPAPMAPPPPPPPPLRVTELQSQTVEALLARAEELGLADDLPSLQKHDVIFELLRNYARRGGTIIAEGILEIAKDGNGFLRNRYANYHTCPEDAQVPVQLIRRLALRPGDLIVGPCKAPADNANGKSRFFVVTSVESVNGLTPALARRVTPFENQTPLFPDRRIVLETTPDNVEMRIVDLFSPIGFGQRGLIVAPPRTGKTVIMQKMANSITANYPDAELIILLIDERPEEVTDMQRTTKAHVISSTFDEPPEHHVQVADLVIEMARRKVEMGKDVIILLDSITRLARAYNTLAPTNGRILSGGVEATALQRPKRFFGSARNIENGGSLTIIATALVETGSRMDEVIFEEFKGTGNMELCLDRALVDKRVFPAINIARSGTRKEDLLVTDSLELTRAWFLRRAFSEADSIAATAMEELKSRLKKFPTNRDFLMGIQG